MTRLRGFIGSIIMAVLLSSCHLIFHPDIEQGNIINANQVAAIHSGMDKQQVTAILGYPIMTNMYNDNRMVYVYMLKPGHGTTVKKELLINFYNDRVTSFSSNIAAPVPAPQ